MKFPALFRRYKEANIKNSFYDSETQSIEDLKFRLLLKGQEHLNSLQISEFTKRKDRMYECFILYPNSIAIIMVNMKAICVVYPNKVSYTNIDDISIVERNDVFLSPTIEFETLIPIGFEKTYLESESTFITPSRIYYSPRRESIYYKNVWVKYDKKPKEFRKKSLYKELIKQENYHGIVLLENGSYDFIK